MKGAPRSVQFDDIYFSVENGLEETAHVFLRGNGLPDSWQKRENFTICETGFGTGLNFLSVWKLFEETANRHQTLDFISVEKYPLTPQAIREALTPWEEYFGGRLDLLLEKYPLRIAGFHRLKINWQITLTLIFDDVVEALSDVNAAVDCWFLDGFTPAKNPAMWSEKVFQQMARLSVSEASYATFTAAGDVRRGLAAAGFLVDKKKGYGHKRDMIAGHYQGKGVTIPHGLKKNARIAIIGGGLAGTACAFVLKSYGYHPVIYEQAENLASAASGNDLGLYNPRFSKLRDDLSDFFAPAYAQLIRMAKEAGTAVNYTPCGALHLMNTPEKEARLRSMADHWGWHKDHACIVDATQASDISGIEIDCAALYLPDSGSVSPKKLCDYYARDIEVRTREKICSLEDIEADAVILACSTDVQNFAPLSWLSIESVRGQVSLIQATAKSRQLRCNLCYGGYLSAAFEGMHMTGSTFEKWVDHTDVTDKNHAENIALLKESVTGLGEEYFMANEGRAGLRAATNDRFPVVGRVPDHNNIYVSAAFGSHGVVGSIAAAHHIADLMRGGAGSLSSKTAKALSPQRFWDRLKKRGSF